jgi:hypothetical protein
MSEPFAITTCDPRFDPAKPVMINGYRFEPHGRANVIWAAIEQLTAEEGCSVTVLCANPDFNGQPQHAIDCNGDWTGWADQRFAHDNHVECFRMAVARMEELRKL